MMRIVLLPVLLAMYVASPASGAAQDVWPVSFEANIGLSAGHTAAEYRENNVGVSADVLLGVRLRRLGQGALVAAASAGVQGGGPVTDVCILKPDGSCVPSWPGFGVYSLLGGWETSNARIRVMAGPALVRVDYDPIPLALSARLDAAIPLAFHVALMGSLRALIVPEYEGDSFQLVAFGIGFRIR